ncbi:MAG: glycoside hydrolase family 16 protein [Pseudobutyrivibrio sp.]|nr:glycoside hydrolase family 16 protein [Pseudobutyrivibrio sp.]
MNRKHKLPLVLFMALSIVGLLWDQTSIKASENLLGNQSFSSGKTNWYELGPASVTSIVGESLRVGTGEGGMGQTVPASANREYVLKGKGLVTSNGEIGYLGVDCLNSNGQKISGGKFELTFTGTNYVNKELDFTTVPGTSNIQVYTYKNPGWAYAYFDDISLEAYEEETPSISESLLNNGFQSNKQDWYELGPSSVTRIINEGAASTTKALRIGAGEGGVAQQVAASSNAEYTLLGYGRASAGDIGYLGVDCMNDAGEKLAGGKFEVTFTGTGYTQKSITFTTVPGTTKLQVYTYKNQSQGYADFDEINIVAGNQEVEEPENGNPSNGGAAGFYDEFNGSSLNTDIWETVDQVWGAGNHGVSSSNVSLDGAGHLIIRGTGDLNSYPRNGGCIRTVTENYASGSYEVRMKAMPQMGALSAMWTYYNDGNINHEIDIELPGNRNSFNYVLCTDWIKEIETNEYRTSQLIPSFNQADGQYHTYRFDWHTEPGQERVEYYVDGQLLTTQYTTVPFHSGKFWVGVWFPNNWCGEPNFDEDYLYIDYVKYTPFYESGDVY